MTADPPIHIVDYGAGNIRSVANALWRAGAQPIVVREPEALKDADRIVLPGVGASGAAMDRLRETGLGEALDARRRRGCPIMGICVGMQVMAETLHEFGQHPGLNWVKGRVERLAPDAADIRVPNIGWRKVAQTRGGGFWDDALDGRFFYFCHSYRLAGDGDAAVAAIEYGGAVTCAVQFGTVFACQFHPEKSQIAGHRLLEKFVAWRP
ncbi:MAG: imidazole glycerol phosphate synthase subunit HisH [Telmatospirillum sp.]|nr:imidazole glycerol phosphate synthase subunit HisH [Telmatospirillum sp.]